MRSLWCWLETRFEQHLTHRRRRDADAEALEFADNPFVSPVRVLPGESQDQLAERALERRSPGPPARVGPAAGDQLPMPAQQRLRLDRKHCPGRPGQRATQRRQQRSIGLRQLRPRVPPAQDRQLVAENQDFQFLRATRPRQQPHQREQVPDDEIRKRPEQNGPPSTTARALNLASRTLARERGRVCEPYEGWFTPFPDAT